MSSIFINCVYCIDAFLEKSLYQAIVGISFPCFFDDQTKLFHISLFVSLHSKCSANTNTASLDFTFNTGFWQRLPLASAFAENLGNFL